MKRIEVTIDDQGNVQVEAHGYKGGACKAATDAIEKALGKVTGDVKKPEYFQGNVQGNTATH